jgi:hypothetical protein
VEWPSVQIVHKLDPIRRTVGLQGYRRAGCWETLVRFCEGRGGNWAGGDLIRGPGGTSSNRPGRKPWVRCPPRPPAELHPSPLGRERGWGRGRVPSIHGWHRPLSYVDPSELNSSTNPLTRDRSALCRPHSGSMRPLVIPAPLGVVAVLSPPLAAQELAPRASLPMLPGRTRTARCATHDPRPRHRRGRTPQNRSRYNARAMILGIVLLVAASLLVRESTEVIVILSSRRVQYLDTTGRCVWRARAAGHLAVLMPAPRGCTTPPLFTFAPPPGATEMDLSSFIPKPCPRSGVKEMLLPDKDFAAQRHLVLSTAQETTAIFKSPLRCFMC